jgi:hypothetical protein
VRCSIRRLPSDPPRPPLAARLAAPPSWWARVPRLSGPKAAGSRVAVLSSSVAGSGLRLRRCPAFPDRSRSRAPQASSARRPRHARDPSRPEEAPSRARSPRSSIRPVAGLAGAASRGRAPPPTCRRRRGALPKSGARASGRDKSPLELTGCRSNMFPTLNVVKGGSRACWRGGARRSDDGRPR